MKLTKRLNHQLTRIGLAAVLLLTLNLQLSTAQAQATAFTYQGRLDTGGGPASGSYDLTFTMFNATTGGTDFGTVTTNVTFVTNGLFTVTLDFGSSPYISGAAQWLEIAVRTNGAATFSTLAPRQPLHSTPYAYYAYAVNASSLIGQVTDANLAATFVAPHSFTHPGSSFTGNGSGLTALNASQLTSGSVPDARLSANVALRAGGNALTGNQTVMSGNVGIGTTTPQQPLDVVANSSAGLLRLQNTSASGYSVVNLHDNTGAGVGGYGYANPGTAWNAGNSYIASTTPFVFMMGGGLTETVRITPAGNVGIGTTSPGAPLDVLGQMQVGANGTIQSPGSKNSYRGMIETSYGNPADRYGISQGPNGALALYTAGFFPSSSIQFGLATGADSFSPQMTINHAGNVGIGTVSPATALDVNGTVTAAGFRGNGSGLTNVVKITNSVFVGATMFNSAFMFGGVAFGSGPNGGACLTFPDGATADAQCTVILPDDFNAATYQLKVYYTATTTSGNFDCSLFSRGTVPGGPMAGVGGGPLLLPSLAAANILGLGVTDGLVASDSRVVINPACR